ncbi:MAG: UbiA family prenyltransferase [candidate division WOR-3 bacterium]|nr:UbiA family prenyltransferase [candidate division WOR-3 bacterium]
MSLNFFHYIFLTRPHLFIPTLIFYLNGLYLSQREINYLEVITLFFISAYAYVINQIHDIQSDRINEKILILHTNKLSINQAKNFSIFLLILSFVLSVFQQSKIYYFFLILLSFLYSFKPFSFKDKPILDLLTNSIGYGFLVFTIGYNSVSVESLIFVLMMACAYMITAILDYEGDRKANKNTTVVSIGIFLSQLLSMIGLLIGFFISSEIYIKTAFFLSFLFLSLDEYKLSIGIPLLILLVYPSIHGYIEILIISILLFLASEIYYRLVFKRGVL